MSEEAAGVRSDFRNWSGFMGLSSPDGRTREHSTSSSPASVPTDAVQTVRILPEGVAASVSSSKMAPLKWVGPYLIEQLLNRGGMGVVYKAYDTRLKRPVAIKMILSSGTADSSTLARFRTEAEAVASLQHPNIVQIYEVGEHEGSPYLALEFVDGPTLQNRIQQRDVKPIEAAQLTLAVAKAIDFAHRRGIVHCDLKPGNILLADPQTPKVTDFGLARLRDTHSWHARPGEVLGTPNYMAPEQAEGDPRRIGPATDIYALGAVLYELLAGVPPFHGMPPMETLLRIRLAHAAPPRSLNPKVPRDLEAICLKCLEKEPAARYATASELADDLERFLDHRPIRARRVSGWEIAWKWVGRNPLVATLVFLLIVSALTFQGVVFLQWRALQKAATELHVQQNQLQQTRADLDSQRWALTQARLAAEQSRQKAEWALYRSLLVEADREFSTYSANRARLVLDRCPRELRAWEWHYLRRRFEGTPWSRRFLDGQVCGLTAVPNSSDLLIVHNDGLLHSVDSHFRPTGTPTQLEWRTDEVIQQVDWLKTRIFSTNSRLVAHCLGRHVESGIVQQYIGVWDLTTGKLLQHWPVTQGPPLDFALSDDGRSLAVSFTARLPTQGRAKPMGGWIAVHDVTSGQQKWRHQLPDTEVSFGSVEFFSGGKEIVAGRESVDVWVFDATTGRTGVRLALPKGMDRLLGVHVRQPWLILRESCSIRFVDLAGSVHAEFEGHQAAVQHVAFSPDGLFLVTSSSDQTVRVWDVTTRRCVNVLVGYSAPVKYAAFFQTNKWVATIDEKSNVKLWDLDAGSLIKLDMGVNREWNPSVGFGPDGKWLACACGNGKVVLWDVPARKKVASYRCGFGLMSMSVSLDGQRLAVASRLPNQVSILDRLTGETKHLWRVTQDVETVTFAPDGQHVIVTGERGLAALVHAASGEVVAECEEHVGAVTAVSHHPRRRLIATGDDSGTVHLWGTERFPLRSIKAYDAPVSCAAFSPDGRYLATGVRTREHPDTPAVIRIWNVATGEMVKELRGHERTIWCLAWHPSGKRLASGSEDMTVRIWEPFEGQHLLTLKGPTDDVRSLSFSPDGRYLASSCDDRFVRIWDATPLDLVTIDD